MPLANKDDHAIKYKIKLLQRHPLQNLKWLLGVCELRKKMLTENGRQLEGQYEIPLTDHIGRFGKSDDNVYLS